MKITKASVDNMTFERAMKAADYRWDDALKGFGVRVYASGRRIFIVSYRNANRVRRFYKLGEYGVLTVEQARAQAKHVFAEVLRGNDPQAERQAKRNALTVSDFCDQYLQQHAEMHKAASSRKQDERMIETKIKPKLGKIAIEALTRADVDRLHKSMKDTPYEANRVLAAAVEDDEPG